MAWNATTRAKTLWNDTARAVSAWASTFQQQTAVPTDWDDPLLFWDSNWIWDESTVTVWSNLWKVHSE